jgi:RNase_H superfamily
MKQKKGPKILLLDIETAPLTAWCWGMWQQDVGLIQIKQDWHLLSWSAKWLGEKEVMYQDQRGVKNIEDDRNLLKGIWELLDQADICVTQNGKNFDHKKLNARFIINGMQPPSTFKYIDTLMLAKKHFGFTSNKLEYMSEKLCTKYKKLKHKKFPGFEMWKECMAGNLEAWKEMEKYNKHDVLALEELYSKLIPWDSGINFEVYYEDGQAAVCSCGASEWAKNGFSYTSVGKYQRYSCRKCGAERRSRMNLISKEKRQQMMVGTTR